MPGVCRLGDNCTGHDCFGPRTNDSASGNVFVNSTGVHRQGDHWITHCCGPACHDSVLSVGSSTVYINGMQAGRIGDAIGCGSVVASGSGNVFFG